MFYKSVEVAGFSAKEFQSVYITSPVAITMVYWPVIYWSCSHFLIRHLESYNPPHTLSVCHNWRWTRYYY